MSTARTGRAPSGRRAPQPGDAVRYEISDRIRLQALPPPIHSDEGSDTFRPLRIYTLDPSVSHRLGGVATVKVPFEELKPGPVGALFDIDLTGAPAELAVRALDLDDRAILLSGGLTPSPSEGRFHLQMAYAVCSLTYAVFQRALGREIIWSCGVKDETTGRPRLSVRPFALRDKNAYFSRELGCVAMGYFKASRRASGLTLPGGLVFTGLSHDILVHETTHALLDALRSDFSVPSHPDVLGFHEGFADLVALFQHFSYPGVVAGALREARGSLAAATLLVSLAREFGHATARGGPSRALRSAVDVTGLAAFDSDATASEGDVPRAYSPDLEVHQMGSVLVSAVFEAFTTIFRRKTERYLRLAGHGGDLNATGLSDELVEALAAEASAIADHFLNICVRAVDYCPPAGLELGEYLRALITADLDVVSDDKWGYREALLRSFRRRHLFPDHVAFMSEDAVRWQPPAVPMKIEQLAFSNLRFSGDPGHPADPEEMDRQAHAVGEFVTEDVNAHALHLATPSRMPKGMTYASPVRVQSVRCARRATPNGRVLFDLIAEVTQSGTATRAGETFDILGGCTLVIAPSGRVRYAIYKKMDSSTIQERQHEALKGPLSKYWRKEGRRYLQREDLFKLMHLTGEEPDS